MADLVPPLRSLRDSLHSLLDRLGANPKADRVVRAILKVNTLIPAAPTGTPDQVTGLRELTEDVAGLPPRPAAAAFNPLFARLETALAAIG